MMVLLGIGNACNVLLGVLISTVTTWLFFQNRKEQFSEKAREATIKVRLVFCITGNVTCGLAMVK